MFLKENLHLNQVNIHSLLTYYGKLLSSVQFNTYGE